MRWKKISKSALRRGVTQLGLLPELKDAANITDLIPMYIDPDLMETGTSGPENAALYLGIYKLIPERMVMAISMILKEIRIVGSDKIDDLYHEGIVVDVPGIRNAYFDPDERIIYLLPPEELSRQPPYSALLHEIGHLFYDAMSQEELMYLSQAVEAGEVASDYPPAAEDEEENFAESFRAYYMLKHLTGNLGYMMELFDKRLRSAKDTTAFLMGK